MDFAELNGRVALGIVCSTDYIAWATEILKRGEDSESLAILAGLDLDGDPDASDVNRYFNRSLDELGLRLPTRERALLDYARYLCREIVLGRIAPVNGLKRLDGLYPASGYTRLYSIWDGLSEDLSFLKEEGRCYFNSGLGSHNIESYLRGVAEQFLVLTSYALPDNFFDLSVCPRCGYIGLPGSAKVRDPHFEQRPFPRLHGPMQQVTACANCGAIHPLGMIDYKARQRYLDAEG
ncbi:MAG: hypothetical protein P8045_11735 [Candidatus Thiodiazotropha sp.]|jgi:hypothetical protein